MIEFGHLTHVGLRRELNEDTYYGDSELGLWLVADGMGGHEYGEVASALARESIVREIRQGTPLAQAIRIADEEIIRASRQRNDALPMGTTVVAARVRDNRFEVAWVGDSRVYLWKDGQLARSPQDHSYVQELISQGAISSDQARSHPHRNVVTQALGVTDPAALNVETLSGELRPGMQLLLCSDGLTEEVDDREIGRVLAHRMQRPGMRRRAGRGRARRRRFRQRDRAAGAPALTDAWLQPAASSSSHRHFRLSCAAPAGRARAGPLFRGDPHPRAFAGGFEFHLCPPSPRPRHPAAPAARPSSLWPEVIAR